MPTSLFWAIVASIALIVDCVIVLTGFMCANIDYRDDNIWYVDEMDNDALRYRKSKTTKIREDCIR